MNEDYQLDDVVHLRKPHPCGGYEWRIVRLGADIGIRCSRCGRRILLPRRELRKRTKSVIHSAGADRGESLL